jgi:hypothetical protein
LQTATELNIEAAKARDLARITELSNTTKELYQTWKCTSQSCRNGKGYCYIEIGDTKHWGLDAQDISAWAKWINEEIDPEEDYGAGRDTKFPPSHILIRIKDKNNRNSIRKAQKDAEAKVATPMTSAPVVLNQYTLPPPQYPFNMSSILYEMPKHSQFMSYWPTSSQSPVLRSSPAASESDAEEEMEAYIDSLMKKNPSKADKLAEIKLRFKEEDMTLKKLHEMKVQGLRNNFEVSLGLAMDICGGIKAYQRGKGLNNPTML